MPIIVVTARTHDLQRLAAFEAGADDYVIKPFNSLELLARVRADVRGLRVYVAMLRRKLEIDPAQPKYIRTVSGVGYRLAAESEARL